MCSKLRTGGFRNILGSKSAMCWSSPLALGHAKRKRRIIWRLTIWQRASMPFEAHWSFLIGACLSPLGPMGLQWVSIHFNHEWESFNELQWASKGIEARWQIVFRWLVFFRPTGHATRGQTSEHLWKGRGSGSTLWFSSSPMPCWIVSLLPRHRLRCLWHYWCIVWQLTSTSSAYILYIYTLVAW